jgi:hypothetical protein
MKKLKMRAAEGGLTLREYVLGQLAEGAKISETRASGEGVPEPEPQSAAETIPEYLDHGTPPWLQDEPAPTLRELADRGVEVLPKLEAPKRVKSDPAKVPGVTRGVKEPLWKDKKKKRLV